MDIFEALEPQQKRRRGINVFSPSRLQPQQAMRKKDILIERSSVFERIFSKSFVKNPSRS